MKTKTYIILIAIILISNLCSFVFGRYEIYMAADVKPSGTISAKYPHFYNLKEALYLEKEYANALFEGLHRFYGNDDNELWFEGFMKTKEYLKIDSLNGGDWEDFYYYETPPLEDWWRNYGTTFEPTEQEKDSLQWKHYQ